MSKIRKSQALIIYMLSLDLKLRLGLFTNQVKPNQADIQYAHPWLCHLPVLLTFNNGSYCYAIKGISNVILFKFKSLTLLVETMQSIVEQHEWFLSLKI